VFGTGSIPEGRVLVDPHAHFHRALDPNDIVEALLDQKVSAQAVCDYGLERGNPEHVISYDEFVLGLNSNSGLEIISSNDTMTKVKRNKDNSRLILFPGREMEVEVEGNHGGLLHARHMMHIVVHGMKPTYDCAEEILRRAKSEYKPATIAHPFTIPARKVEFVYANEEERDTVVRLAKKYGAAVEGLNSTNSLWMTPTNFWVREVGLRNNLKLVYSSDAHARESLELTREQVGIAGTTIEKRFFDKAWNEGRFWGMHNAMRYNGQPFGAVQSPALFYRVMIAPRLQRMLKGE